MLAGRSTSGFYTFGKVLSAGEHSYSMNDGVETRCFAYGLVSVEAQMPATRIKTMNLIFKTKPVASSAVVTVNKVGTDASLVRYAAKHF